MPPIQGGGGAGHSRERRGGPGPAKNRDYHERLYASPAEGEGGVVPIGPAQWRDLGKTRRRDRTLLQAGGCNQDSLSEDSRQYPRCGPAPSHRHPEPVHEDSRSSAGREGNHRLLQSSSENHGKRRKDPSSPGLYGSPAARPALHYSPLQRRSRNNRST